MCEPVSRVPLELATAAEANGPTGARAEPPGEFPPAVDPSALEFTGDFGLEPEEQREPAEEDVVAWPESAQGAEDSGGEAPEEPDGLVQNLAELSAQAAEEAVSQEEEEGDSAGHSIDFAAAGVEDEDNSLESFQADGEDISLEDQPAPEPEAVDGQSENDQKNAEPTFQSHLQLSGDQEPQSEEVLLWERALHNKSSAIRKQAARQLKKLTGRDYEY